MIHNGVDLEGLVEQVFDREERIRQHAVWANILPKCKGLPGGVFSRRGCVGGYLNYQCPTANLLKPGQDHCDACIVYNL